MCIRDRSTLTKIENQIFDQNSNLKNIIIKNNANFIYEDGRGSAKDEYNKNETKIIICLLYTSKLRHPSRSKKLRDYMG